MGLFDRIKKSLFGSKEAEKEEPEAAKPAEEQAEPVAEESEAAEPVEQAEAAAAESEAEPAEEAEEAEPKAAEEAEESETEEEQAAEPEAEEAPEAETEAASTEAKRTELYEQGLSKSNKGFGARLNAFLAKFRTVDEDFFDELEELLIESDVGYETSEDLTDQLREEAKLQKAKSREDLKKVIVQKLVEVYDDNGDPENEKLTYDPSAVNGAGKTTTVGKLAKRFHDQGKKVIMVAADTFRAGAVEQLVEWGKRVDVPVVTGPEKADPAAVVYDGLERAVKEEADYLLVDTAGRLQNKVNLMKELEKIQRTIKKRLPEQPAETLLVLDGSTGQNALLQAKDFDKTTKLTGLVLTKLDGSSKGGVVLSIRHEMKLPVKLVGLGEKAEDLADFDAASYAVGLFHDLL